MESCAMKPSKFVKGQKVTKSFRCNVTVINFEKQLKKMVKKTVLTLAQMKSTHFMTCYMGISTIEDCDTLNLMDNGKKI